MSNYTKTTDFEAKDSLPTGDSGKIIRGSEFETEFDAISTAIGTKADTAGPTFTGTLTFETISDGTIGVTAFVDEDDMSSDSATLVPTQQSVKAYVDSQVTAQDLDFQADSGGALSIDLDSETMTFTGGTGIDTSGLGNAVTFAIDSTVATLTGSQTLTNKTLTSPVLNTGVSGTAVLDEDNMASNSATQLATQQSIKAYVDSQVGANNELSEILANGNTTGGTNIVFGDSASVSDDRLVFGDGSDLQIYHSGVHSYIDDAGTGNLTLRGNASVRVEKYEGEILADFAADGAVSLYHDNSVKIATTSTGVNVTGNVAVSGTVDGRDVATDGSKLDGIEALADVTDTANVTAAGALMDSELTSEASVKALNQGVATTDSPTFAGVTVNGTVEFDGLSGTGAVNVTDILDQDDMSSNSATALATQQSIKAYVDSQVATADTLAEVLGNGNTTGGTDITVGTGDDITFADSSKAIFGAGSDLQIYHDGSNSYIDETATGHLFIRSNGDGIYLRSSTNEEIAHFNVNGSVKSYYDNSLKLETTSTGIDVTGSIVASGDLQLGSDAVASNINALGDVFVVNVDSNNNTGGTPNIQFKTSGNEKLRVSPSGIDVTGTVTADGLTVEGTINAYRAGFTQGVQLLGDSGGNQIIGTATNDKSLIIKNNAATKGIEVLTANKALDIANNGDISFYEDTGTTAKLFWDASAESLGIGTTSADGTLHVHSGSAGTITAAASANNLVVENNGPVGLSLLFDDAASNAYGNIYWGNETDGSADGRITYFGSTYVTAADRQSMEFRTAGTARMRIDSSGNVGIGTSSPAAPLSFGANIPSNGQTIHTYHSGNIRSGLGIVSGVHRLFTDSGSALSFGQVSTSDGSTYTERMRIDSSGNVGIGTTSPSSYYADELVVSASDEGGISLVSGTTSKAYYIFADGTTGSEAYRGWLSYDHNDDLLEVTSSDEMRFRVGSGFTEAMRIDSSGNVGIGRTPVTYGSYQVLDVAGTVGAIQKIVHTGNNVQLQAYASSTVGVLGTATSHDLLFVTGDGERLRIDSSGNVGIGTSTAVRSNVNIHGANRTLASTTSQLAITASDSIAADIGGSLHFGARYDTTTADFAPTAYVAGRRENATVNNYAGYLQFGVTQGNAATIEAMRIDSSGRIGIGTTNPLGNMQIVTATAGTVLNVNHNTGGTYPKASGIGLGATSTALSVSSDGSTVSFTGGAGLYAENTAASGNPTNLVFWTNATGSPAERMRLDNSGNLLVGQTTAYTGAGVTISGDGVVQAERNNISGVFNRTSTDGEIVQFRKDGSTVGAISTYGGGLLLGNAASSAYANIRFTNNEVFPCTTTGGNNDDAIDLGKNSSRYRDIYAGNGTIQTSDRNEKQDIEELSEAEQRVAVACKGLLRKFRWKSSVEEKGDDARIHFGIIAQDLQDAFTAEGLDAGRYGMFINSTWTDEETGEERSRMGVRYSELLAFIISAI